MNIYEKLQKCRVALQQSQLKKSGKNTFAKYEYFELGDFLPRINELMLENLLTAIFHFTSETATLTIIDIEKPDESIQFLTPVSLAELKGTHAIQNIGATQTYTRRYLYLMAFEIVESDALDKLPPKEENQEEKEAKEFESHKDKKINQTKVQTLRNMIQDAAGNEETLCKFYHLERLEDMPNEMFMRVMKALEKKIDEKKNHPDEELNI